MLLGEQIRPVNVHEKVIHKQAYETDPSPSGAGTGGG